MREEDDIEEEEEEDNLEEDDDEEEVGVLSIYFHRFLSIMHVFLFRAFSPTSSIKLPTQVHASADLYETTSTDLQLDHETSTGMNSQIEKTHPPDKIAYIKGI